MVLELEVMEGAQAEARVRDEQAGEEDADAEREVMREGTEADKRHAGRVNASDGCAIAWTWTGWDGQREQDGKRGKPYEPLARGMART